jgi:pimeloyl-ACP methyl ester carboxylesterase
LTVAIRHVLERRGAMGLELCVHRFIDDSSARRGVCALLLHGFLDCGGTWDRVAAPLAAAGFDVYAPDLRGFGASDRIGAGGYYHFADYVADVDSLVRAIAPEQLLLIGHSMGGTVACLYAGARPERVQHLVLVEGVGPPAVTPETGLWRTRQWLNDLERTRAGKPLESLDDAVRRLTHNHPRIAAEVLRVRARQLTVVRDGELHWAHDPLHRTTSPQPFSVAHFTAFLRQVTCPVLFVGGGEAGFHPPDEAERLEAFANATRVDVPDAGHMIHWTEPEALARAILAHAS